MWGNAWLSVVQIFIWLNWQLHWQLFTRRRKLGYSYKSSSSDSTGGYTLQQSVHLHISVQVTFAFLHEQLEVLHLDTLQPQWVIVRRMSGAGFSHPFNEELPVDDVPPMTGRRRGPDPLGKGSPVNGGLIVGSQGMHAQCILCGGKALIRCRGHTMHFVPCGIDIIQSRLPV